MLHKFRLLLAALALAVGLGGAVAVSSPAQAAWTDCPSGYFCLWTSTNATGSRFQWHYNTFVDSYNNGIRLGSGVSNRGYSFYNRTGSKVRIFDSGNCALSPWYRDMNSAQYATAQGSDWGGRVSSLQLWNASPLTC